MSTAARPTWSSKKPQSKGFQHDLTSLSTLVSAKDLPSHKKMKYRDDEMNEIASSGSKMGFMNFFLERNKSNSESSSPKIEISHKALKLDREIVLKDTKLQQKVDDIDDKNQKNDSETNSYDEDYESDDDELLVAELERIRSEKKELEEQAMIEQEKRSERIRKEQILHGNPLLDSENNSSLNHTDGNENTYEVKREWNRDVVFMNCARKEENQGKNNEFINDPLRTEFHKKFMKKYIK